MKPTVCTACTGTRGQCVGLLRSAKLPAADSAWQAQAEPPTGGIGRILENDYRVGRKQRHTAKRILERPRDEYACGGVYTIIKSYVRQHSCRTREMFVSLCRPPVHGRCD